MRSFVDVNKYMKWREIFLTFILVIIVFLIQQSLLINFGSVNLLLIVIIWLSFWQRSNSLLVALMSGLLIDWQSGVVGPGLVSLLMVNLLIVYLAKHLSLESFSHYFLISFMGILVFLFGYYLFLEIFVGWLEKGDIDNYFSFSWLGTTMIIVLYQSLLIIGYLFRPKSRY